MDKTENKKNDSVDQTENKKNDSEHKTKSKKKAAKAVEPVEDQPEIETTVKKTKAKGKDKEVTSEAAASSTSKRRRVADSHEIKQGKGVKKDAVPKGKAAAAPKSTTKDPEKARLSRKSSAYHVARRQALAEGLSPTKAKAAAKKATWPKKTASHHNNFL